jgi:hypothetical protein
MIDIACMAASCESAEKRSARLVQREVRSVGLDALKGVGRKGSIG